MENVTQQKINLKNLITIVSDSTLERIAEKCLSDQKTKREFSGKLPKEESHIYLSR